MRLARSFLTLLVMESELANLRMENHKASLDCVSDFPQSPAACKELIFKSSVFGGCVREKTGLKLFGMPPIAKHSSWKNE
jgi:hypothetical protein